MESTSERIKCEPKDLASKSFFLGPQAENGAWFGSLISDLFLRWLEWRRQLFPEDGRAISEHDTQDSAYRERQDHFKALAEELSKRFEDEIPKFSPRYMGHMFSEISLPALVGHWIATLHNPNNISSESAPVGVEVEKQAVALLAEMAGLPQAALGHFTSCGSIANFEAVLRARDRSALWLARSLVAPNPPSVSLFEAAHSGWLASGTGLATESAEASNLLRAPLKFALAVSRRYGTEYNGPLLLVPDNKHYSWVKSAHILGLGLDNVRPIALDRFGVMKVSDLKHKIERARSEQTPIAMVVSVLGTTELGNIDPIHEIQDLLDTYQTQNNLAIWHHIDAAYGGFFLSLKGANAGYFTERAASALKAAGRANSMTIDPHKLGYVPYACGAFLCRENKDYATRNFESPYIQFKEGWDPGTFTMEGSRSASGAAATWLTLKAIGPHEDGYGRIIGRTIHLRKELTRALLRLSPSVRVLPSLDTNIVCFTIGKDEGRLSESNEWVRQFYKTHSGERAKFFVSKTSLTLSKYSDLAEEMFSNWSPQVDSSELHLIRLTLMNPFLQSKEMNIQILEEFCREVADSI